MDNDLDKLLDQEPEAWKPEAGDKIAGTVISVSTVPSPEYGDYPMVEVMTDDGRLVDVHCFHSVMRSALERYNVRTGDKIGIKYLGRLTEGGAVGTGYENYRVVVQNATPGLPDAG